MAPCYPPLHPSILATVPTILYLTLPCLISATAMILEIVLKVRGMVEEEKKNVPTGSYFIMLSGLLVLGRVSVR